MSETANLTYFDGRGRAELVRILLTACKVKFDETIIKSKEKFLELKPSLPYGQLPILKLGAESYVQVGAIVRFLATKHGLCAKTPQEQYKVDSFYEGSRDFQNAFISIGFAFGFDVILEKTKNAVDKYLPIFDKALLGSGDQDYLVGGSLTYADLSLLEALLSVEDYFGKEAFAKYQGIKKFLARISKEAFYDEYMKSIRKPKNNEKYVSDVKTILGFN